MQFAIKEGLLSMKRFLLSSLKFYKKFISPMLPNACRFYPTCSVYAYEAVSKYGVIKGVFLGVGRILRCHPFSKGGYDPVPQTFGNRSSETSGNSRNLRRKFFC